MPRRRDSGLHGVLVIDKPVGPTSHDIVARLRRSTGQSRIGHAGTLDPVASGVLPICVGATTRLVEHLAAADKAYLTEIVLGRETATDDVDGETLSIAPVPSLPLAALETCLAAFRGEIHQRPPRYAAISVGGQRLHAAARAGRDLEAPARPVRITRLEILDWTSPCLTLLVECGKGTYIRSLARDIGQALGCGGHVQTLRRVRTGPFCLADCVTLHDVERAGRDGWARIALPMDAFLADWPAVYLSAEAVVDYRHGRTARGSVGTTVADGAHARVYGPDGEFLGTAQYGAAAAAWQPLKVLTLSA